MASNDGRVGSNFIVQAIKGESLTVYGDGTQTRSFCYVDYLIEGFMKHFFTQEINEQINFGKPTPICIKKLADEVIALIQICSKIEFRKLRQDVPGQKESNLAKVNALLSWIPLGQGLKDSDVLDIPFDKFSKSYSISEPTSLVP